MESNRQKYSFDDFTHSHYIELLELIKANYSCVFYNNSIVSSTDTLVLWRHDVDLSVHEALNLARIESDYGIKSTYFLLLHSEYYNLLEQNISLLIKEIIGLGHQIGLHFDPLYYNIESLEELEAKLLFEKSILESLFSTEISAFSFHNPTEEILKFNEWSYGGMINTYAKELKENISYCSDSNGHWRFFRLYDLLTTETPQKIQVLTHPEWWTDKVMSPREKILRCIDGRAKNNFTFYCNSLKVYGRTLIDW